MQFILTVEQIGIIVAVVSVVAGVILGLQSGRDWAKSRNAGMFLQYHLQAFSEKFLKSLLEITNTWEWKDITEFWEKYGKPETYAQFISVGTVFDSMGVLVKRKYISIDMVPELLIVTVKTFWNKVGPIAGQMGIDVGRPNTFHNIEYLFNEIQKLEASQKA